MNEQEFRTLWTGYNDALMARDVERALAFYTDDIVYDESPMMMKVPRRGKRECAKYWTRVFDAFSKIEIATSSLAYAGDRAWIEWTMNNFHRASKTPVEIKGALTVSVRDGKLATERLYWDSAKLFGDLGAWNGLAKVGIGLRTLKRKLGWAAA